VVISQQGGAPSHRSIYILAMLQTNVRPRPADLQAKAVGFKAKAKHFGLKAKTRA